MEIRKQRPPTAYIAITSQHYLDKRLSARVGLGGLLTSALNVAAIGAEGQSAHLTKREGVRSLGSNTLH